MSVIAASNSFQMVGAKKTEGTSTEISISGRNTLENLAVRAKTVHWVIIPYVYLRRFLRYGGWLVKMLL